MRTQVAIVGAGPAGLVLAHLLARAGIESVVLELRSREYVEKRIRAGVLEHGSVDLLVRTGVGERLQRQGLVHHGIELLFERQRHRIPLTDLTGRSIVVYGQQEVVKDLIQARLDAGGEIVFEAGALQVEDAGTEAPRVVFEKDGRREVLEADFVAGCDGFHGVSRAALPAGAVRTFEREYPFAWLGILAQVPPSSEELIYAYHERGFALHSMRSPELTRLYLQVPPDEDLGGWPDARVWEELSTRFAMDDPAWSLRSGPVLEKGVTAMRSFVVEPMQFGRLYLAGDAAHIVPPTGAKGMNLAIADVRVLAEALVAWYGEGREDGLAGYSEACLRRVWRAEHFSWWMTSMLHRFASGDPFEEKLQLAQLRYVAGSPPAAQSLAENYVGLEQVY